MVRSSCFPFVFAVPVLLTGLGCAPDFEPASKLDTLRVLGIQKDKPYARPGDTVTLSMLVTDSAPSGSRPIEINWLGGFCENPPGDLYTRCFDRFLPRPGEPPFDFANPPKDILLGSGPVFQLPVSKRIISSRGKPVNARQPLYGVSFVFFTACAGTVTRAPEGELVPFACYSPTGERVDQSGFVVGYTEVFASNTITNHNPVVTGFEIDDQKVPVDCTGTQCIPPYAMGAGGNAGLPPGAAPADAGAPAPAPALSDAGGLDAAFAEAGVVDAGSGADAGGFELPEADPCEADSPGPACIDVCTKEKQDDCKEHTLKLLVDGTSQDQDAEKDDLATTLEGHDVFEQAWINYYTEGGKIPIEVKLLSDATLGYKDAHATKLLAPKKKGPFHVWAVAHDNRGGTGWVRLRMSAH